MDDDARPDVVAPAAGRPAVTRGVSHAAWSERVTVPVRWCLRRGRSGSGMAVYRPPTADPGKPSRPPPGAPAAA